MPDKVNYITPSDRTDQVRWYRRLWVKSFVLSTFSLILLILIIFSTTLRHQRERGLEQLIQTSQKSAELLARELGVSVYLWDKASIEKTIAPLMIHNPSIRYVAVYSDRNQEKHLITRETESFDFSESSPLYPLLERHPPTPESHQPIINNRPFYHIIQPILVDFELLGSDELESTSLPLAMLEFDPSFPLPGDIARDFSKAPLGDVHVGVAFTEVEERLHESRKFFLKVAVPVLLFAMGFHYWQSKRLTGALTQLSQKARSISAGVYDVPLQVHSQDEIGVLSSSFYDMVTRLLNSRAEIEKQNEELETTNQQLDVALTKIRGFNEELEHKVLDRTRELETLNMKLQNTNNELRLASETKDRFLGMMSHELRTPLNAIIGFSQLALGRTKEGPHREFFMEIKNNGDHLLNLINDVLDFTKLESGKFELFFSLFELESLIAEITSSTTALLNNKLLEIKTFIDPAIKTVYGDRVRVKQVLLNLASNATKFTHQGQILFECRPLTHQLKLPVEIPPKYYERTVCITVSDTGTGISESDLQCIFERFKQVDTSETRMRGTGLGLAISRSLMELHHSTILASSREYKGTVMITFLPYSQKEMKELVLLDK